MSHQSELIATDIEAYLAAHERKDLLRFLTCGSVDDGKSTLIGRLLHDSKMIYEDQLTALAADSTTQGSAGEAVDLALLMDGLKAEREQGITIDVAYRYFSTARRKFIIADTPGHEQYTRNMVTGASTCQLAIILIDARYGVTTQTRRHSYIASLLGIGSVVIAVNKMDLVEWSEAAFNGICEQYRAFASDLKLGDRYFLPISALCGDNLVDQGENLPWFDGPTLMEYLETVSIARETETGPLRLPIQMVTRPDLHFRGFAGTISGGTLQPGDPIVALPSGMTSTVERIVTFDGDLNYAQAGQAVTVTLTDEIDVSRGDILVGPDAHPVRSHGVEATLVWLSENHLEVGGQYLLRSSGGLCNASVTAIRARVDINTLEESEADTLRLNDIARCAVNADRELVFDPYDHNRVTGSFVLVDHLTNATVAAGMLLAASSRWDATSEASLVGHPSEVSARERAIRFGQKPVTILLTGLTAAGKSTIATMLERELFDRGKVVLRIDGENARLGISRDLGFSDDDRSENVRRVAEVAHLVNNQGLIVIAALVAPHREVRARARQLVGAARYIEVFVDTPVAVCRQRDSHGIYAAADTGEIKNFPGVSAPYERPTDMDLRVDSSAGSPADCVAAILSLLVERGILRG